MAGRCGVCAWCREAVLTSERRYLAGNAAVHAECMEEYLLGEIGVKRLAALAGFEERREEDDDEISGTGAAAGMVSVLPGGQREEHFL